LTRSSNERAHGLEHPYHARRTRLGGADEGSAGKREWELSPLLNMRNVDALEKAGVDHPLPTSLTSTHRDAAILLQRFVRFLIVWQF